MSDVATAVAGHVAVASDTTKAKIPSSKKKATGAAAAKKHAVDHPKYSEMVHQALSSLKERGGSSRQAVLKFIMKNFNIGVDENVVNTHLKMALRAGVKNATLKQSKGSGATGSFRLGEEAKKKPKAVGAAKKAPKKAGKASSTTAKVKKTVAAGEKSGVKSPKKKMTKKATTKSATTKKAVSSAAPAKAAKVAAAPGAKKSKVDKPKKAAGVAKKVKAEKPKKSASTAGTTKVVKKPVAKKTTTVAKKPTKPAGAAVKKS